MAFGGGRLLAGRGIFDKETRRKPLVFAGDAHPVTLYMEIEWQFRRLFASGEFGTTRSKGVGAALRRPIMPQIDCGAEENPSRGYTRSVPRASGFVLVAHSETIGSSHSTKSYSQFLVQSETGQIPQRTWRTCGTSRPETWSNGRENRGPPAFRFPKPWVGGSNPSTRAVSFTD